jgi:hypothetical protein
MQAAATSGSMDLVNLLERAGAQILSTDYHLWAAAGRGGCMPLLKRLVESDDDMGWDPIVDVAIKGACFHGKYEAAMYLVGVRQGGNYGEYIRTALGDNPGRVWWSRDLATAHNDLAVALWDAYNAKVEGECFNGICEAAISKKCPIMAKRVFGSVSDDVGNKHAWDNREIFSYVSDPEMVEDLLWLQCPVRMLEASCTDLQMQSVEMIIKHVEDGGDVENTFAGIPLSNTIAMTCAPERFDDKVALVRFLMDALDRGVICRDCHYSRLPALQQALNSCAERCFDETAPRIAAMLCDKDPSLLESRDERGRTPLMLAVRSGNAGMVRFLLGRGADLRAQDNSGVSVFAQLSSPCAKGDKPKKAKVDAADSNAPVSVEQTKAVLELLLAACGSPAPEPPTVVMRGVGTEKNYVDVFVSGSATGIVDAMEEACKAVE